MPRNIIRIVPFSLVRPLVLALACAFPQFAAGRDIGDFFEDATQPWLADAGSNAGDDGEEHLETDRDSFTPATTVVGKKRVLVESSYSFLDNRGTPESHSFPELLTRIGITDRVELRLGWNYEIGGGGSVSGADLVGDEDEELPTIEEEAGLLYGVKLFLTEQQDWLPQSSFILQANTPTAGPETSTQFTSGYVFGWELPNEWLLDAALRYAAVSEEGDHFNQWAPSIVVKVPVHERWDLHAEYFGIFSDNRANEKNPQYFSPGIHYLISPDCEIGVRVGWGLNNDASRFFSNFGIGVRF